MRAFRNSLILCVLGGVAGCSKEPTSGAGAPAQKNEPAAHAAASVAPDYYPLAVGNKWQYACSVEGMDPLTNELEIVRTADVAGHAGFAATSRVNGKPSEVFLYEDTEGRIHRAYSVSGELDEVIALRRPAMGDKVKESAITRTSSQSTPATGTVDTLVLENFNLDDPSLPPERRAEWRGYFFAKGVGLVAEADGTGGECALQKYHLQGAH